MAADVAVSLPDGVVIPAHPLALTDTFDIDWEAQRMLSRYYLAAGVDGLAVGVHTTQFELHDDLGQLADTWTLTALEAGASGRSPLLVAGICGDVGQAVKEAEVAREAGYQAALLCPWGMTELTGQALLTRAATVGEVMPTFGFYLQDSVGGVHLDRSYWRSMFDLESVIAVKTAPFDRYRTNDVLQVLVEHDRWQDVAVLTGNDDAIVHDLVSPTRRTIGGAHRELWCRGGLLGQWAVGTRAAVELMRDVVIARDGGSVPTELLARAADLLEVNAAVFDVDHGFAGCVAGVNEVLRQQGLLSSSRCLGGRERLSDGQPELITSVRQRFPHLLDESFIGELLNGRT